MSSEVALLLGAELEPRERYERVRIKDDERGHLVEGCVIAREAQTEGTDGRWKVETDHTASL